MSRVKLSEFNNDWFDTGSKLKMILWLLTSALLFRTSLPVPSFIKIRALKAFGASVGVGVVVKPSVHIKYPWKLSIGDFSWVGEDVWIDNLAQVNIGSNCCVSQGAYLLTGNHDYTVPTFDLMLGGINIKDGAWVGAKSVVCPGVTLEPESILTVGSIATKPLTELGIYQGNPAVKVKQRVIK